MNDIPTSGPIPNSKTHHARDTISSRHSLFRSHRNGDLGERKEHLFQILASSGRLIRGGQGREFLYGAFTAHVPAAEQNKPVAEAFGVADLMNRQEECPSACRVRPERGCNVASLTEVETLEGL